jgi:hypothetical protein
MRFALEQNGALLHRTLLGRGLVHAVRIAGEHWRDRLRPRLARLQAFQLQVARSTVHVACCMLHVADSMR